MKEQITSPQFLPHLWHNIVYGERHSGWTAQIRQNGMSFLLWVALGTLFLFNTTQIPSFLGLPPATIEFFGVATPLFTIAFIALVVINRAGFTRLAGLIFITLLTLIISIGIPLSILNQALILYTLPILGASFLVTPFASIIIALLGICGYTAAWAAVSSSELYRYPSLFILFLLSIVVWQISARTETAIRKLRESELKLQNEIKDRRETLEVLNHRNREMATLLDSLPGFAFFKDKDFRYITANQTFCDAIGCPKNEIKGKTDFDLLPRDSAVNYRAADLEIFRTGTAILDIEMEMREPHGNGRILVATRKVPLRNDDGEIIGLIGLGYDITARKIAEQKMRQAHDELIHAYNETLEGWAYALEMREQETAGHSQRVVEATIRMAKEIGFNDSECIHIQRGAFLHDIGKMGIPDHILLKPGPLDDEEWKIMRRHPQHAFDLLNLIEYLRPALDIPYCHHEKWDGTGYPRGLKGEDIPLQARIFSVVDVWDALTSNRPYRKAWPESKVIDYLKEQSGTHFDPKMVDLFLKIRSSNLG